MLYTTEVIKNKVDNWELGVGEGKEIIFSFDLQDLLEMLPKNIEDGDGGNPYYFVLINKPCGYIGYYQRASWDCLLGTHIEETALDAVYEMVLWCVDNGYI